MSTTPYVTSVPLTVKVRPKKSSSFGSPVNVMSLEIVCVSAKAMLSVPSVTMKGGSRTPVTSPPCKTPKPTHVRIPNRSAGSAGTPFATASLVMMIWPSAITVPTERSIPAVRMTRVWPIASTPTTRICWRTSEMFPPWKNRSLFRLKNSIVTASASSGPTVGAAITRRTKGNVAAALRGRS